MCLYHGDCVDLDIAKAVRYRKLAAGQGYANAQYNVGMCFCIGRGVAKDIAETWRYWKLAAEQGHVVACMHANNYTAFTRAKFAQLLWRPKWPESI